MVERRFPKPNVEGSSPSRRDISSINNRINGYILMLIELNSVFIDEIIF